MNHNLHKLKHTCGITVQCILTNTWSSVTTTITQYRTISNCPISHPLCPLLKVMAGLLSVTRAWFHLFWIFPYKDSHSIYSLVSSLPSTLCIVLDSSILHAFIVPVYLMIFCEYSTICSSITCWWTFGSLWHFMYVYMVIWLYIAPHPIPTFIPPPPGPFPLPKYSSFYFLVFFF
jgi:hypothetical protein